MCDVQHWYDPDLIDNELRKKDSRIIMLESKLRDIADIASIKLTSLSDIGYYNAAMMNAQRLQMDAMRPQQLRDAIYQGQQRSGLFGGLFDNIFWK